VADDEVEVLAGGVGNAGAVVRVGATVLRPTSAHTPGIHALLAHVRGAGFTGVPEVLGIEPDGCERLRFVPGDVALPPFPAWSRTDEVLASTAALLHRFHDATAGFVPPPGVTWSEELADPTPGPDAVLCHNDVCPENVVCRDGRAVVLLDWEFAAPGRRLHDLAALVRMCGPTDAPGFAARTGRQDLDPGHRIRVAADGYGLAYDDRIELLDVLGEQIARGGDFVRRRVEAGEPAFVEMWEAMGGQDRYDHRHEWFEAERPVLLAALR
jgi:aminoglycoside phosphotransferase (APT) family kinase protein